MFETEADEKRDMPLEEGKGPGAEEAPPSKDPSPAQELPSGQDLPPQDSSSEQEPTPGQESPSSKDSPPYQEPSEAPLSEDSPPAPDLQPCQDLPAAPGPTPSQDPPLAKGLADIPEPPAQDLPACGDLPPHQAPPPAEALAEETTSSGDPPATSRPTFVIPEVRLDRTYSQKAEAEGGSSGDEEEAEEAEDGEEGEEDEEEDTSDDNYGGHSEAKRSSMIETGQGAEGGLSLRVQNSLRRRTHSEGSLLQEARGPCFSSDTTLHCSDGEGTASTWAIPSPRTLKKELGRNGGSMHHLSLFFTGHRKMSGPDGVGDDDEASQKRKSKNLVIWELAKLDFAQSGGQEEHRHLLTPAGDSSWTQTLRGLFLVAGSRQAWPGLGLGENKEPLSPSSPAARKAQEEGKWWGGGQRWVVVIGGCPPALLASGKAFILSLSGFPWEQVWAIRRAQGQGAVAAAVLPGFSGGQTVLSPRGLVTPASSAIRRGPELQGLGAKVGPGSFQSGSQQATVGADGQVGHRVDTHIHRSWGKRTCQAGAGGRE
ncbi:regulator of G-protein signaling 3-like [Ictidomys tridecemlineatus]|nr:regulator of G-protein signaling 3-like [Ictidomys tridecemlineatus]